jgi:hypothetical protein
MRQKLYAGPVKGFYRVTQRSDQTLCIEVLHDNYQWRKRLLGTDPRVRDLPRDVVEPSKRDIRAAVHLARIIEDFPDEFRDGCVCFVAGEG